MYHFRWTKDAEFAVGIAMRKWEARLRQHQSFLKSRKGFGMGKSVVSIVGSNSVTGPAIERFFFDLVRSR